ncbi:hypothetical protein LTR17_011171 [Elasticomyces elasticus]|nr:hypothetical protein LTR17_011171 [Elasticomyces elasticus]
MPTSREEHLASSVAYAVQRVHLDEAWPGFLPAHIGHSPMVDLAATALVKAHDHAAGRYTGSATSSLWPYTEAMSRLRVAIASPERAVREETAITVGLLTLVEHLLTPETRWPRPVARGDVQPAVYKLRWMSHQLFLRLPALIVLVRKLREFADVVAAEEAVNLAGTLLKICDDDVEIEFVRSLRTTETLYNKHRTIKRASDVRQQAEYTSTMTSINSEKPDGITYSLNASWGLECFLEAIWSPSIVLRAAKATEPLGQTSGLVATALISADCCITALDGRFETDTRQGFICYM